MSCGARPSPPADIVISSRRSASPAQARAVGAVRKRRSRGHRWTVRVRWADGTREWLTRGGAGPTRGPWVDALPFDVVDAFGRYHTRELSTVAKDGTPTTWPTTLLFQPDEGRFVVGTAIGLNRKALHVRREPRVAMLFGPDGHGPDRPADDPRAGGCAMPGGPLRQRAACSRLLAEHRAGPARAADDRPEHAAPRLVPHAAVHLHPADTDRLVARGWRPRRSQDRGDRRCGVTSPDGSPRSRAP